MPCRQSGPVSNWRQSWDSGTRHAVLTLEVLLGLRIELGKECCFLFVSLFLSKHPLSFPLFLCPHDSSLLLRDSFPSLAIGHTTEGGLGPRLPGFKSWL